MQNNENKKIYRYINLILIVIYCCMFIKSIIDGRFNDFSGNQISLIFNLSFWILLIVGLFTLIAFIFCKLKLLIPYIIFTLLIALFMLCIALPGGRGGTGFITFPWYYIFEFEIILLVFILFPIILVVSLVINWFRYK